MFRLGKREGYGKMVWSDGSVYTGQWKDDERLKGKMIMNNGWIYIGSFKDDLFHGDNEQLLMTTSNLIYQGKFRNGKTANVGMVKYSNGDIYYGQLKQMARHGVGKILEFSGSFKEGFWAQDKLHG